MSQRRTVFVGGWMILWAAGTSMVLFAQEGDVPVTKMDAVPSPTERILDDFERSVQKRVYQVLEGDDSTLDIDSSRESFEGTFSLQMEYKFSTTRPWGSWVSVRRSLSVPLDGVATTALAVWVKGDGSDNVFRVAVGETGGGTWEYLDRTVLKETRWTRVVVPVSALKVYGITDADKRLDLSRIASFEFGLLSERSSQASGAKSGVGRVFVDRFALEELSSGAVEPAPVPEGAGWKTLLAPVPLTGEVAGVNWGVSGLMEYTHTPEQKSRVIHFASLVADAGVEKFGARVDVTSKGQEFGESAAYVGSTSTVTEINNAATELRSVEFIANNLHPLLRHVAVGNIFNDFSVYTFSPLSGFKGISGEGDYRRFNYQAFVLKHMYDSFTAGTRMRLTGRRWSLEGIAVDWQGQALLPGGSEVTPDGELKPAPATELDARTYARDWVATGEARVRLLDERVSLSALYGQNRYRVYADVDYSDPFNPLYLRELDQAVKENGDMVRASANTLGLFWDGLGLDYEYRWVDTAFKPRYRQDPFGFDNQQSDQEGHRFHLAQWHQGWVLSADYDQLRRLSNDDYRQYRTQWGVGRYGIRGVDVGFNQTITRSRYVFASDRSSFNTDEDQRIIASELSVRAQLFENTVASFRPRHELKHDYKVDDSFTQDSLHSRLEYFATTNVKLNVEHKTTRYARHEFEPTGFPFDDNFFKMTLEVSF